MLSRQKNLSNSSYKILIVHWEGNINNNPNLSGLVEILCEQGYQVDIASPRREGRVQQSPHPAARLLLVDGKKALEMEEWALLAGKPLRSIAEIQAAAGELDDYDFVFGVDRTIVEASVIAHAKQIPYALISYEIFFASETSPAYKKPEIMACQDIEFSVCQDPVRAEQLSRENHIPLEKMILIPVAGRGCVPRTKSFMLHDRLGIDRGRNIAIFSGCVETHCMIEELIRSAATWPQNWALVLHNRYGLDKRTLDFYSQHAKNEMIFFSTEPVDTPGQMHTLLHCAEIGVALYKTVQGSKWAMNNIRYLGLASGKISTYLQHGLPVLTNEIGQMSDYVRKYSLGKVHSGGLPIQVQDVAENLVQWSRNTQPFFRRFLDLNETSKPLLEKLGFLLKRKTEKTRPQVARSDDCPSPLVKKRGMDGNALITVATSLAPGNVNNQQKAVRSWRQRGFQVLSVNDPEEIHALRPHFEEVRFVLVSRNGREHHGKPLVYIDDILQTLKETQAEIVGIINSDIHLSLETGHLDAIVRQTQEQEAVVCVSRMNVSHLGSDDGEMFVGGFDAFFFNRNVINKIPASTFCLGAPLWDYYVPMVCILNQIPLIRFQDPIAFHINHALNWDKKQWFYMARYFFQRLLELCRERVGYNQFSNLGGIFGNAWKCYHLRIVQTKVPEEVVQKSIAYPEFILGIICGQMRILDKVYPSEQSGETALLSSNPDKISSCLPSFPPRPVSLNDFSVPLVSAIVSTYNSESLIRGCLQDLVEQTLYQKGLLEIIVVNSGSRQDEEAIVREFQRRYPNIQYIRTEERETVYAAWNRGIRESRGKYITNANTDDRHAPEMLEKLALALEQNPDVAYVYSPFYVTRIPNQTWESKTPCRVYDWHPEYSREKLLQHHYCRPQPMWRRSLHDEYGYFDERMKSSGDYEFALRISQTHKLMRVPEVLGLYFQNPDSLERTVGTRENEDQWIRGLYGKSRDIIRRPFRPGTDIEFPDLPDSQPRTLFGRHPSVSVYIVAYNTEKYVAQAIQSVLAQTYPHYELIILDDGSTDRTAEMAQSYKDNRIRFVRQEHKNFAAGMNRAIQMARGEFVIGVDSDDFVDPDYLERLVEFAMNNPDFDYYYPSKLTLIDEVGRFTGVEWEYMDFPDSGKLPAFLFANAFSPIPNSSSLKRKSMFGQTGLYRELDNVEDFDFLARNAIRIRFKKVTDSSRYYYRKIEKSNTTRFEQRNRITVQILEEIIQNYPKEILCPFLSGISNTDRQEKFRSYVTAIFEKHARTYRDRSGEVFEQIAQRYKHERPMISNSCRDLLPSAHSSLKSQLHLAMGYIDQGDSEKAASIYRRILSNKNLPVPAELRDSIEKLLEKLTSRGMAESMADKQVLQRASNL